MRLYSTLHRDLVELPAPPAPVGVYACGPTVYQRIHVGNARPYVLSLWLKRWLESRGHAVTLVENITDVNDKIYDAAPGRSAELAARASEWYREDTDLLGLGRPDHEPKATETVPEIVALIEDLIGRGLAYPVDGDVYFRVAAYPEYGRLSNQRVDALQPEDENPLKESPHDFALWKAQKPGEDTSWEAPWGRGRPGWHIECSAMAEKFLGPSFEIHMGGIDLRFPHHENEIAQSRGAGRDFALLWMHNGMLEFTGEKMSKSVGNVVSLREAVAEWGPETILLLFLGAHWRKPMDYSVEALSAAAARGQRLREVFLGPSEPAPEGAWERFEAALEDDFNTPEALAVLHEWRDHELVRRALELFGLGALAELPEAPPAVVELAQQRQEARARRHFEDADRLRDEIAALGWDIRDVSDPPGYQLVPRR